MSANKGRGQVTSYCDWMSQLPAELHNVPLFNLAIPGSHDSMSYDLDINSSVIEPDGLKRFSKICCVRRIVHTWAATQEEPIAKQLDAGVRYFDLRIACKPNNSDPAKLCFYHGLYTKTDVATVLKVIADWAERHPKEILILALSHFKGFERSIEEQLHVGLINLIKTLFGSRLVHRVDIPSLKSCWDKGRNVIVSYDYPSKHPEIWSKISYYYGDSMEPAKVESVLRRALEKARPSQCFFVCGLNLTLPEDAGILWYIFRPCDNFARVTLRSLPELLRWMEKAGDAANIVASDVVTRDDFVPTIVQLNFSKQVTT